MDSHKNAPTHVRLSNRDGSRHHAAWPARSAGRGRPRRQCPHSAQVAGPLSGGRGGGPGRCVVPSESIPRAIEPAKALAIVELRHKRLTQARIAAALGVSKSTVSRVLARAGLYLLSNLDPVEPIVRYEHEAPGDMLSIEHVVNERADLLHLENQSGDQTILRTSYSSTTVS